MLYKSAGGNDRGGNVGGASFAFPLSVNEALGPSASNVVEVPGRLDRGRWCWDESDMDDGWAEGRMDDFNVSSSDELVRFMKQREQMRHGQGRDGDGKSTEQARKRIGSGALSWADSTSVQYIYPTSKPLPIRISRPTHRSNTGHRAKKGDQAAPALGFSFAFFQLAVASLNLRQTHQSLTHSLHIRSPLLMRHVRVRLLQSRHFRLHKLVKGTELLPSSTPTRRL